MRCFSLYLLVSLVPVCIPAPFADHFEGPHPAPGAVSAAFHAMENGDSSLTARLHFNVMPNEGDSRKEPVRIACVGNSITHGGMGRDAWPQQLGSMLGEEFDVRNFGVGGCTLLKKGDFPYWNEPALSGATGFDPHIVIILLGTNDSKPRNWIHGDAFFDDYMDLVGLFRRGDRNPVIFTAYPPPVFRMLAGINHTIIRDEMIPVIDSVRTAAATRLIDFFNPMLGESRFFPDGVHPSAEGYALMARIAAGAVLEVMPGTAKEKENH